MAAKRTTGRITKKTRKLPLEAEPTPAQVTETFEVATPAPAPVPPPLAQSVQAPIMQAPIVQAPVVPAPIVQAPIVQAPIVQAPIVQAPIVPAAPHVAGGGATPVTATDWVAVVYEGAAPHFDHDAGTFVRGTRTRLRAGLARRLLGRDGFRLA